MVSTLWGEWFFYPFGAKPKKFFLPFWAKWFFYPSGQMIFLPVFLLFRCKWFKAVNLMINKTKLEYLSVRMKFDDNIKKILNKFQLLILQKLLKMNF